MKSIDPDEALLPAALLDEIEAVAAVEHRSAREMLREAVERFLRDRLLAANVEASPVATERRSPREAASRMIERRKLHPLPDGVTIGDLLIFGRA